MTYIVSSGALNSTHSLTQGHNVRLDSVIALDSQSAGGWIDSHQLRWRVWPRASLYRQTV